MFSMELRSLAYHLVNKLLVKDDQRQAGRALHLHFDCRLSSYHQGAEYNTARGLHLLYQLPPDRSYVSVFSAVVDSPFTKLDKLGDPAEWTHETTHDSAWRDISVFTTTYLRMSEEVNAQRAADNLPHIAPYEMSEYNNFSLFGEPWEWVEVEITKDPTDVRNYRRLVKPLLKGEK